MILFVSDLDNQPSKENKENSKSQEEQDVEENELTRTNWLFVKVCAASITFMLIVALFFSNLPNKPIHTSRSSAQSNHALIRTYESCDRSFKKGSENYESIKRTNMCTNCYNNFITLKKALDEMPVG